MTICARVSARLRKSEKVQEGEKRELVVRWRDMCVARRSVEVRIAILSWIVGE